MKKSFLIILFFLTKFVASFAQPMPCTEDPPQMTPTCLEACVICDIDGFTGRHNSAVPGEAPDDFCTFTVHNAQWIAFIAGSENLVVNLEVSNCQTGLGLEVAIYEGIDCENFRLVSNCYGGLNNPIGQGESQEIANTEPLVIGQYYYLVMDGALGDNCDWTFTVIEGSTFAVPLSTSGEIIGEEASCPETQVQYYAEGVEGGTFFEWKLDGALISAGQQDTLDITWPNPGVYELCLTISNACDMAEPTCETITVNPFPVANYEVAICEGDCFMLNDTISICEAGAFSFSFPTDEGCDSMIFVNIEVLEATMMNLSATICDGSAITIGNTPYSAAGTHETILENHLGCDSLVILDLSLVVCEMMGEIEESPVVCNGENSGMLHFQITDGTAPFTYSWEQLGSTINGNGTLGSDLTIETITGLTAGTYLVTVSDNFGNDVILIENVSAPPALSAMLNLTDYNGFAISCFGFADGMIETLPQGGTAPYNYNWNNAAQTPSINNLTAGDYSVMITDAVGCEINLTQNLSEPPPLVLSATFVDPDCGGINTGFVEANNVTGGTAPYLYDLNNSGLNSSASFSMLPSGNYTLTIEDANGCIIDSSAMLEGSIIPVIDAGEEVLLELGESTQLSVTSNILLDSIVWSPAEELSCVLCPKPTVAPITSTVYTVTVTSQDGCVEVDSVKVNVVLTRDVFVPNVFSPNNDGVNDQLVVFGGPEVLNIKNFQIFDRWGAMLTQRENFLANDSAGVWNGRAKGSPVANGVYLWTAEIEFIDGVSILYKGDVMVLK